MNEPSSVPAVLCFGEMLWDSLPQGLFPGGAPMNVAYHLRQLGLRAAPVSAVGKDALGDELLRRVTAWGLETSFIRVRDDKPTGLVRVTLKNGSPTYEIVKNVAWDWIELPGHTPRLVRQASALIFGSLAQRSAHNRQQLTRLRELCGRALKVFDVNLRPPHDPPALVWSLAEAADVIKLNDDEARRLLQQDFREDQLEPAARALSDRTGCPRICITAGATGAGLLMDAKWNWSPSQPIKVKDTIGAGDSFLAALVHGLLNHLPAEETLSRACRLAEFVAASDGATPAYQISPSGISAPPSPA
jgi:fructokinase